ncbi:MAG: RNA polymerase sigma factor [bacterium]|nr:RNA polymerase sigma factor [bacterium]
MRPTELDSNRELPAAELSAAQLAWIREQQAALWRYLLLLGARPEEAEDVMQDAFVALLRRYPGEDRSAQARLLRTIARNRFVELRRRRGGKLVGWSDAVDAWLADRPEALQNTMAEQFEDCLGELTERARVALMLRHAEDQPVEDIARHVGLARGGALTLLQRSRDQLRACLERRGFNHRGRARSSAHGSPETSPALETRS